MQAQYWFLYNSNNQLKTTGLYLSTWIEINTYYLTQLHHNETMFALSLNCVLFQIILRALASFIVAIFCSSDCFITFISRISLETTMKIKLRALGLITTKSFYSFFGFIPLFFRNGGNQFFTRSFLSALAVLTV